MMYGRMAKPSIGASEEPDEAADCRLRVDCQAIRRNLDALRRKTKSRIMAVVKNDGYGLSLLEYASLLAGFGIEDFAVGNCREALALRDAGIGAAVLLLTPQVSIPALRELLRRGVALTVGSLRQAEALRCAARETGIRPQVHIKIDTGLGRYGFAPDELQHAGQAVRGMEVLGTYTHFASPYADPKTTRRQYKAFLQAVGQLNCNGVKTGMLHCCASGGLLNYPEMHMDIVRPGSAILGRVPDAGKHGLAQAVFLEAPVLSIRPSTRGTRMGYRGAVGTGCSRRIGVVGVGGAFAFPREGRAKGMFAKRKYATVNGSRARVLGPLGIGALALDLTGVRCADGDTARLDVNPLHCAGFLRKAFDYGGELPKKDTLIVLSNPVGLRP
jgi:alanine racemase